MSGNRIFKEGDKVVCIDIFNKGFPLLLTNGNVYRVLGVDGSFISILNDTGMVTLYSCVRFNDIKDYRNTIINELLA